MSEAANLAPVEGDNRHILVVDDDTRIRTLLQRFLTTNGYRITMAADAAEARHHLKNFTFDLIVLDIMMPGEDGLSLTASLRKTSDVPVLLLTARGEAADRIAGLESGADDYLAKPFEPRELLLRIAAIGRRARAERSALKEIRMGAYRFDPERGEMTRDGHQVKLTGAETALLRLLSANAGKPISRLELAQRTGAGLERSIDVQVTRLRRKIEDDPKMPLYLQTVRSIGYVLIPDGVT
ncbi:Transcriptional regulatory protein OmpR [Alphaproteobacteria bacterium SO-S41]|nr:Transcriptional regulatory protein OmpR [Alphaproteobacteria bacterium SO-S41]